MNTICVGLISDTHGLLRPEAVVALQNVDHIIHAGDIGNATILERLANIAPVTAVRGNNDNAAWADTIPAEAMVEAGGAKIYVLHDLKQLAIDPHTAGIHAVISGHSHCPLLATKEAVLFVNPGSAGPRRFKLPVSVGFIDIHYGKVSARLLMLDC